MAEPWAENTGACEAKPVCKTGCQAHEKAKPADRLWEVCVCGHTKAVHKKLGVDNPSETV